MRSKTIFGALLVSVALCSQGFGFELLDRMLGLNGGGCGECKACAKVASCDPVCAKTCAPACAPKCAKPLPCCPATCDEGKACRPTPIRDLFANIKDLFEAKARQCDPVACEATKGCATGCAPEACAKPAKCRKVRCEKGCNACEPACKAACEPACEVAKPKCHKLYRRPVLELIEKLFGCDDDDDCGTGCDTGCGSTTVPSKAGTPAKAPEAAAPLPAAPKATDPSASIQQRGIYQASRSLVRN